MRQRVRGAWGVLVENPAIRVGFGQSIDGKGLHLGLLACHWNKLCLIKLCEEVMHLCLKLVVTTSRCGLV